MLGLGSDLNLNVMCVYMCCCSPAFTCPQDHQERRGENEKDPGQCKRNGGKVHAWAVAAGHLPSLP